VIDAIPAVELAERDCVPRILARPRVSSLLGNGKRAKVRRPGPGGAGGGSHAPRRSRGRTALAGSASSSAAGGSPVDPDEDRLL